MAWNDYLPITHTEYPFGKGALTTNGVQYCNTVDVTDSEYVEIESVTIEPIAWGAIKQVKFNLEAEIVSSATDKDALYKWQARDKDGTWVDMVAATIADVGTTAVAIVHSGYFKPEANFEHIPFDVRLVVAAEDTTDIVSAKTKNSSYVTVMYKPFVE